MKRLAAVLRSEWTKAVRLRFPWVTLGILALVVFGACEVLIWSGNGEKGFYTVVFVTQSTLGTLADAFLLVFCASLISREGNAGTIRNILVTPVSRGQFLLGKWFVVLLYSTAVVVTIFLFGSATVVLEGKASAELLTGGSPWVVLVQASLLTVPCLVARGSFALLLSAMTDNMLVSIGFAIVGILALDVGKIWLGVEPLVFTSGIAQVWNPVLDLVSGYPFAESIPSHHVLALTGLWTLAFLVAAWMILLRREFQP